MAHKKLPKQGKIGGVPFFVSLIFMTLLSMLLAVAALSQIVHAQPERVSAAIPGMIFGASVASLIIRGKLSVFLHELKHSILANLVGNRAKEMKVRATYGYFLYEYTRATAKHHAFISLAPYIIPLFSIAGALLCATVIRDQLPCVVVWSICYGIDLVLNLRDISPYQSDFNDLRGGFTTGLLYVIATNIVIGSLALAWICAGSAGVVGAVSSAWTIVMMLALRQ